MMFFYEPFYSALSYTSQPYAEAMDIHLEVTYTPYDEYSKEKTGNIITFTQIEEGGGLSKTCN